MIPVHQSVDDAAWTDVLERLGKTAAERDALAARLADAERERDEWESRYEELLSRCGGTMP